MLKQHILFGFAFIYYIENKRKIAYKFSIKAFYVQTREKKNKPNKYIAITQYAV